METNGWRGPHLMKSSIKYPIFQSSLQPWMHTVEWDFWWRLKWSADGIISLLRCPFRLPFPCVWIPHLYPFTYPKHGFIQACAGQHFSFSPKIRQWKMCLQVLYNIVRIKSTQINSTMIIKWLKKNGDLVDHFAGAFLWFDDDFFMDSSRDTHEFQKVDRHQLDISSPALSQKHGELGSHQLNGKRDKQR